jgi:hypothetical protein
MEVCALVVMRLVKNMYLCACMSVCVSELFDPS